MTIIQYAIIIFLKKRPHIDDLFQNDGKARSQEDLRTKLDFDDNIKFYWIQIIQHIPSVGKILSPLCSFCMKEPESQIHLFHSCTKTNFPRMQLKHSFQNALIIPPITPQSAIFGFTDQKVIYHLINHILLIFQYYVYKTR